MNGSLNTYLNYLPKRLIEFLKPRRFSCLELWTTNDKTIKKKTKCLQNGIELLIYRDWGSVGSFEDLANSGTKLLLLE